MRQREGLQRATRWGGRAAARLAAGAALALAIGTAAFSPAQAARLELAPDHGPVGTLVTARASGLPAGTTVHLAWQTADARWHVEGADFLGVTAAPVERTLATAVVALDGTVSLRFTVPVDYGYVHNLFVEGSQGRQLARQGFVVQPTLTISPTSGPVGTPIHVRFTGLGYRFYHLVWHLLYDGGDTGMLTGLSTRGTADATIPATGTVGPHTLQAIVGTPSVPYLNEQQAPISIPQIPLVESAVFTITPGPAVASVPAAEQGLPRRAGTPDPAGDGAATLALEDISGPVGSPIVVHGRGFPPSARVELTWGTVVGNRISGAGWQASTRPLATVTSGADGAFAYRFATPDDLGGPHPIVATAGSVSAKAGYILTPSVLEVSPRTVRPGGDITVHLKGVGWTATANIYTLVMDDSLFGYACGFNSAGDVTIHIKAPGRTT